MKKYLLIMFVLLSIIGSTSYVQAAETSAPLFVREDCVWEFEYKFRKPPFGASESHELLKYKFDGTEEIDGKTYHKLKNYHITRWDSEFDEVTRPEEEDCDVTVGLIREENGKVWMRNTSDCIRTQISGSHEFDWDLKFKKDYDVEEIMIFDFTVDKGDKILSWTYNPFPIVSNSERYDPGYYLTGYEIKDIEKKDGIKIYSAGYCYNPKAESYDTYQYAEGVGIIGVGTILGPEIVMMSLDNATWYEWRFNNLYDPEGNVIYSGKGTVAGVGSVKTDNCGDGRMYDVLGREVSNPQRGTIYIQNGRKFIAR